MKKYFTSLFLMFLLFSYSLCSSAADPGIYLTKPTGAYGVGFQDFDWIRNLDGNCERDDQFSQDPQEYSPNNPKHCHETVVRIYYPSIRSAQLGNSYYPPYIKYLQDGLRSLPSGVVTEEEIQQLGTIKSYTTKDVPIVAENKFPILVFTPGMLEPAEAYENFLTELASQGYIVAAISTPFLNFTTINGTVVYPVKNPVAILASRQQQDLEYVLSQINILHAKTNSTLFSSMDVSRIGIFGHSIGGNAVELVTHKYENDPQRPFQAAMALDIGLLDGETRSESFKIPFMHQARADQLSLQPPHTYVLGENGYLVVFSPKEQDHNHSKHMSFSDFSTLQYTPALKAYFDSIGYQAAALGDGDGWEIAQSSNLYLVKFFNIFVKGEHDPTLKKCEILSKFTYLKCGPRVVEK